jgi:transcriptional regulator with XRE-family HTH domain
MDDILRRHTLAEFLQTRRARLTPVEMGLPPGVRRRTPGLRREEVAQLAGVGLTWYTWLEQGRDISVSDQVLESIATTLQLDPHETRYLFTLAHPEAIPITTLAPETITPALQRLLAVHEAMPAFILGRCWNILAWNDATTCLLGELGGMPEGERNHLWLMFLHPGVRQSLQEWERHAQRMLAEFRVSYGRYLEDERCTRLVERLQAGSAEFRAWWPRHEVVVRRSVYKEFVHPQVGRLSFEQTTLLASDAPELKLVVKMPLPGTDTTTKLARLLSDQKSNRSETKQPAKLNYTNSRRR